MLCLLRPKTIYLLPLTYYLLPNFTYYLLPSFNGLHPPPSALSTPSAPGFSGPSKMIFGLGILYRISL